MEIENENWVEFNFELIQNKKRKTLDIDNDIIASDAVKINPRDSETIKHRCKRKATDSDQSHVVSSEKIWRSSQKRTEFELTQQKRLTQGIKL